MSIIAPIVLLIVQWMSTTRAARFARAVPGVQEIDEGPTVTHLARVDLCASCVVDLVGPRAGQA